MSLFYPMKQASILIPSASKDDQHRKHLFILLTDPQGKLKHILTVSLSSVREGRFIDDTCRLYRGDHAFIKHDTFVHYKFSRIIEAEKLLKGVQLDIFTYQGIISLDIFEKICHGVCQSPHTPRKMKIFFTQAVWATLTSRIVIQLPLQDVVKHHVDPISCGVSL